MPCREFGSGIRPISENVLLMVPLLIVNGAFVNRKWLVGSH